MTTPTELQRDILGVIRDIEGNLQPDAASLGLVNVDKALDRAVAALNEAADIVDDFRKASTGRIREGGRR